MSTSNAIGFFDSGFGGLDVFREVVHELPNYSYTYLADSARAPYGTKSRQEVLTYTTEAVEFLFARGARLVVLACNTASSDALRSLQMGLVQEKYPGRNLLGVLIPAVEEAVRVSSNKRIGVIGTPQTIASGSFDREVKKLSPNAEVFATACPLLVPLIESGKHNSVEMKNALAEYLRPLVDLEIDTLILGCTHYGLIEDQMREIIGENIRVVRESRVVPNALANYLQRHPEYSSHLAIEPSLTFYTTDPTDRFGLLGSEFFGQSITATYTSLQ